MDSTTGRREDTELTITRRYPVAAEKVWRAWTDPQALSAWFGPGPARSVTSADMDVRPEGRYCIRFRTPDGQDNQISGVYEVVEPHQRLVFSWAWQSTPDRVSRVAITLRPYDGGTELELLHDRFFDRTARDNHLRGWPPTIAKLDAWVLSQA